MNALFGSTPFRAALAAHVRRFTRLAILLGALGAIAAFLAVGRADAAVDPLTCAGYAEQRVLLESQSGWWPGGTSSYGAAEHVHSAACFPLYQDVSGVVRFDVRAMLHNLPVGSRVEFVRVQVHSDAYGVKTLTSLNPKTSCASADCTFWYALNADTALLPNDGRAEFRIHVETRQPDGTRNLATNGFVAYVRNGKAVKDTRASHPYPDLTEGRGWYRLPDGTTQLGYENARLPKRLPVTPLSGTWTPRIRTLAGSGGEPVTRTFVSLDPAFHAMPENPGHVLVDVTGGIDRDVAIDTMKLANGPHKLFIRAEANEPNSNKLSGALVLPFTVQN